MHKAISCVVASQVHPFSKIEILATGERAIRPRQYRSNIEITELLPKRQGQRNQNAFSQPTNFGSCIQGIRKTAETGDTGVANSLPEGENNNSFRRI